MLAAPQGTLWAFIYSEISECKSHLKKKQTFSVMVGWIKPMCSQGSCSRVNTEVSFGWSLQSKHFCYSTSSKMKAPVPQGKCTIKAWDVTLSWKVGAASWLLSAINTRSNGQFFHKVVRGTVLFPYTILIPWIRQQITEILSVLMGELSCKVVKLACDALAIQQKICYVEESFS